MTNIVLMSWLMVVTNSESISIPVSPTEQEQVTKMVEYRSLQFHLNGTVHEVPLSTNVLSTVRSTLRFNGTNWVPGLPEPKPVVTPPMPPGLQAKVPKPSLPRFAIPTMPPALPDAAMLEKERIEREKVAKDKRDPKRRS